MFRNGVILEIQFDEKVQKEKSSISMSQSCHKMLNLKASIFWNVTPILPISSEECNEEKAPKAASNSKSTRSQITHP